MPQFCKAFPLKSLRAFNQWDKIALNRHKHLVDNTLVYMKEDYMVSLNAMDLDDQAHYVISKTPANWVAFCQGELMFQPPDWQGMAVTEDAA